MKTMLAILLGLVLGYGINASFVGADDCGSGDDDATRVMKDQERQEAYPRSGVVIQNDDGSEQFCSGNNCHNQ